MTKSTMTSKCISVAAHFEGLVDAPEQYRWHRPMQHVQGYPGSHWTLPLGNYSFQITPVAARATANKRTAKNGPALLAILMAMAVRRYTTGCIVWWRRSRASLENTGCRHWVSIMVKSIKGTWLCCFFLMFSSSTIWKRSWVELKAPVFNRGITYQMKEKGLTKVCI